MDYKTAVDYILKFADFERMPRCGVIFDLKRIERLLEKLGNPEKASKAVHIAGTKGKGSTSAMIASILVQSGYKTGLYTSPHLLNIRERIQIDGKPIGEEALARVVEYMTPVIECINRTGDIGELTTFELLTALAFSYFRDAGVEYQVLETGLGGRLDATNVVKPEVSVITSISFDHMDVLGNTLTRIAGEKAGIIKPGRPVVCSPQLPEAMQVIERVCKERGANLVRVGDEVTWCRKSFSPDGQSFELKGLTRRYDLLIPLLGGHQLENAAAAVATAEILSGSGVKISPEKIAAGLEQVYWPGRLQVLSRKPWIIIDGAHNAYSSRKLVEALKEYFEFDRLILVFGASSDKHISGMVAELAHRANGVIVTSSKHPRATKTSLLVEEFSKGGKTPQTADSVASALRLALDEAKKNDLICITGSIFVIAEALEIYQPGGVSLR